MYFPLHATAFNLLEFVIQQFMFINLLNGVSWSLAVIFNIHFYYTICWTEFRFLAEYHHMILIMLMVLSVCVLRHYLLNLLELLC